MGGRVGEGSRWQRGSERCDASGMRGKMGGWQCGSSRGNEVGMTKEWMVGAGTSVM